MRVGYFAFSPNVPLSVVLCQSLKLDIKKNVCELQHKINIYLNKEGDSVSPSGYRATITTAVYSRMSQTSVSSTTSTKRYWRPPMYPATTLSPPLNSPQSPSPNLWSLKWPQSTTWTPYSTQLPKKPQKTPVSTSLPGESNQVSKRPRGRGRGYKRRRGGKRSGSVRLVSADGFSDRGRVEIFIRGEWGTVCDDLFTRKAGTVVCRQLGFTTALAVMKRAALGEASSRIRILLDDVECEGGESSLLECKRSKVGKHNCSHEEDVGVICG